MSAINEPPVTLEDVLAAQNLNAAYAKVKANAGVAGVDGRTVGQTAEWIAQNRESFLAELHAGRYRPAAVQARDIAKAEGGHQTTGDTHGAGQRRSDSRSDDNLNPAL
jgi:RNA-directed DNA polymerase